MRIFAEIRTEKGDKNIELIFFEGQQRHYLILHLFSVSMGMEMGPCHTYGQCQPPHMPTTLATFLPNTRMEAIIWEENYFESVPKQTKSDEISDEKNIDKLQSY